MDKIRVYAKPSAITFKIGAGKDNRPTLDETSLGVTFRRDGAICMRVETSGYQAIKNMLPEISEGVKKALNEAVWIINLQTGRVFVADKSDRIEYVKVVMTLDGE